MAVPAAPLNLTAVAGDGLVTLNWDDPNDASITGYEYSVDGGEYTGVLGSTASTVSYTVPLLTNGTQYSFKVRAVNADGNGAGSSVVTATPVAPAPQFTADAYSMALTSFDAERGELKAAKRAVADAKQAVVDAEAALVDAQAAVEKAKAAVGPAEAALDTQKTETMEAASALRDLLDSFING